MIFQKVFGRNAMRIFYFTGSVAFILLFCTAQVSALAPKKSSKDFPNNESYSLINKQAEKIAEDLCKGKSDRQDCEEGYIREYIYLAFLTCEEKSGNAEKTKCYKSFEKDNTSLGKARQAAGFDKDQRVDASTSRTQSLVFAGADGPGQKVDQCGKGENAVQTKFNFGCAGDSYKGNSLNPILDVAYTIIRFLSVGVGIVVVGSIIYAGILYSSSQGNPEQTQAAKNRIRDSIIGLVLYLFIFALVQYLVPGGLFT